MNKFSVAEEVIFEGERYVVSQRSPTPPFRYRLLASRPAGTRFIWAEESQLSKIDSYHTPLDDTRNY